MSRPLLKRIGLYFPLAAMAFMIGCANAEQPAGKVQKEGAAEAPAIKRDGQTAGMEMTEQGAAGQPPADKKGPAEPVADPSATKPAPVERKIIYKATLEVVVKDLDVAVREVDKALAEQKGRIIKSEVRSDTGARRTGTFTLEVPVGNFRPLVDALAGLGYPERKADDSQDVTEEYLDIQIRLRNLKEKHESLLKLRKEKAASLDDVLKLDPHISAVQTEIDRVEGRLNYLETKAAFSTITLTLKEIKDYVPPSAPTFGDRISRTFSASWEALLRFGEGVVLFAVALTPWLPILIPLGVVGFFLLRKAWRTLGVQEARPVLARRARPVAEVVVVESPPESSEPPSPPEAGST